MKTASLSFGGACDSEYDSGNRLDFPGPDQLSGRLLEVFPSRGGFCARVNLGKNSTHQHQLPLGRPCKLSGSVKPSAGTKQRCEASARRYAGLVVMVSARALIVYHGRLRSTIASRRLYCQHGRSAR